MNFTTLGQFYNQLSARTRTILVAVVAFGLGTFFGGSGAANGRYIPVGGSGALIMDTRTGTTWKADPDRPGFYTRLASFSFL
jgi:photosystem II stability/assembly factor-like uncharacterized protein